jgi:hypothetical protein
LTQIEIRELNRLTTILLDIFEDQLDLGKLTTMMAAGALLDQQLKFLSRAVLRHGGRVKSNAAKAHAEKQYEAFDKQRKEVRHAEADAKLAELKSTDKALPKSGRGKNKN